MKILVCHRPGGAFAYISDGWINALNHAGITVTRWDGNQESWEAFDPDLYIGCSGHRQPIPMVRGRCKVALHVNPHGPRKIEPNINESQDAVRWVREQNPDAVFGWAHESDREIWSGWEAYGYRWVPLATAGDATIYNPGFGTHDQYDFVYLGGRWAYKGKSIDRYLIPLCNGQLNFRLHGWGDWPPGVCSGELPNDPNAVARFFCSGKVAPCISEHHTVTDGIDLPERVFKVALSGALAIHDPALGLERYVPNAVRSTDPESFQRLVRHWVCVPDEERQALARLQYQDVISSQTYHHRMATLLEALRFPVEAQCLRDRVKSLDYYNQVA